MPVEISHELPHAGAYDFLMFLAGERPAHWLVESADNGFLVRHAAGEALFLFSPPPLFPSPDSTPDIESYAARLDIFPPPALIILMQAGDAALGLTESGDLREHKTIHKYMVRKGQGRAQITHLKTKGKSRLGSRIRLANTIQFFAEINRYLRDWLALQTVAHIFYQCPVRLWAELFSADPPPPFTMRDRRLQRISRDLPTPSYALLLDVNRRLHSAEFRFFRRPIPPELNMFGLK